MLAKHYIPKAFILFVISIWESSTNNQRGLPMKKILAATIILASTLIVQAEEHSNHHAAHWGYEGDVAPAHWGELSDKFKLCSSGENQSPIDIKSNFDVDLPVIQFDYSAAAKKIINNGHTIQVDVKAGSSITVDGKNYQLKQFHFHTPSENKIKGKSFPLEAHFVHRMKGKNIFAVVAVMFDEGAANPILEQIWNKIPSKVGESIKFEKSINYTQLLPKDKDYYRFNGSFTTPPCTEGVYWHVLKTPLTASKAQIAKFLATMHHPNNRNIQKTGARVIVD